MVILPVESKNTLEKAVHHLKKGGVIVYPTETSYGIGCIATNVEALEKISVLKGRNEKKVYILLVKNLHMAKKYGIFSKKAEKVAKRYWPGPLTLVLKTKMKYSPTIVSNKNELALRHSSNMFANMMIEKTNIPLVSTSANREGEAPCYTAKRVVRRFGKRRLTDVLILDGGVLPRNKPSTIARVTDSTINILRQGSIIFNYDHSKRN